MMGISLIFVVIIIIVCPVSIVTFRISHLALDDNSAFHPSGVDKSSRPTGLQCVTGVKAGRVHFCPMAGIGV